MINKFSAGFKTKKALNYTAQQYRVIGKDMAEQTSKEIETLLENLFSLKGTIQGVPDILNVHKVGCFPVELSFF